MGSTLLYVRPKILNPVKKFSRTKNKEQRTKNKELPVLFKVELKSE
jgi:hypothetical protein